jgi:dihydroxyacetone kinase
LAGTLFVHKIAGAAAEYGEALTVVVERARRVAEGVRTLGVSLSGASVPGRASESRIADGEAELGLGIHGEPGVETIPVGQVREIIDRMAHDLAARLPAEGRLALLVNNLGGVAALEMGVILHDLLESDLGRRCDFVFGPAAVMTAMDMRGFSLSALPIDAELVEGLRAPVGPLTAWPHARRVGGLVIKPLPAMPAVTDVAASENAGVSRLIEVICAELIASEADLNALDALVGDGDTGSTFATAALRIRASVPDLALNSTPDLLGQLSGVLSTSMGGSSGVLGSIFLAAAAAAVRRGVALADALHDGLESIKNLGGATAGDRTMIDALEPAIVAMQAGAAIDVVAAAAVGGAESTAAMTTAKAGRSAYVAAHHLAGVQDPGATAIALIFEAVSRDREVLSG